MTSLLQDIRFGLRNLARHRGFALTTILTLALGIGANSAIFSLLDPLVFRPLAVPDEARLQRLFSGRAGGELYGRFAHLNFVDLRREARSFDALAAFSWPTAFSLGLANDAAGGRAGAESARTERVWGVVVSGNYFDTLGVPAALGRTFAPDEDRVPDLRPVAVISHRLWETHFGADPGVVGRSVRLNGRAFDIIGVAPRKMPQVDVLFPIDIWVPMMMQRAAMPGLAHKMNSRRETWLSAIGRLRPGVTRAQAGAELATIARRLEQAYPTENRALALTVLGEREGRAADLPMVVPFGWGLLGTMGLVLLMACANIASLALARSLARRKEFVIRLALGAGRGRLVRQLLTESLVLAVLGGACGLAVAAVFTRQLIALAPPLPIDVGLDTAVDLRVVLFTTGVSLLTGLLIGLLPASRAARLDLASSLHTRDADAGGRAGRPIVRDLLVSGQVAVSLVLLIVAGLFVRSLQQAQQVDLGFVPDDRLLATVDAGRARYSDAQARQLQTQLLEDLRTQPGVLAVTATAHPPLAPGYLGDARVFIDGETPLPEEQRPIVYYDAVGPRYVETLGSRLVRGRDFTDRDRDGAPRVAIVNERFARAFWPGREAVGQRFRLNGATGASLEIVGVVADGLYQRIGEPPQRHVFLPLLQGQWSAMTLVLHLAPGAADRRAGPRIVRDAVRRLDGDLPVTDLRSMREHLGFAFYPFRVSALLLGAAGLAGLGLTMVGLYGVLAFVVRQRAREVGVRVALGARPRDVMTIVLRRSLAICAAGLLAGTAAALALTRLLGSALYGVQPWDPWTFALAPALLLLIALGATIMPTRQALAVDPIVALRQD